ncbi:SGNH/GDSL hydrolase family protein [Paenibacillus thermoaerophilus]|uniref:SGNH/GDSL hydrolase family protein n=1 Tax=Paenibacillus thermoaerophilus TaxID=1215385 RepID=A0ABW2UZJ6_9BACL|nr:SGNH/GDSL hydrolase family protein [Paenibacillus thermoaerophilus]TMV14352.1 hypothetical protein FE781_10540 [Paenibacillus thermoaerophilus]
MSEQTASNGKVPVSKLDENMRLESVSEDGMRWHSPARPPFRLEGFPWFEYDGVYRRLPKNPRLPIPAAVDALADCTAGGQIRFRTNSKKLALRVRLDGVADMNHMPATGQCSFDCYLEQDGVMRYHSTGRYNHTLSEYETVLISAGDGAMRSVTLYFPLYRGVKEVLVGLEEEAELLPPPPLADDRRILIYGTSITQGGCANRPGMAYPNIMSRRIPLEMVNLGFSGNGKGEPEVAEIISDIPNPAMLVLDYECNCSADKLDETCSGFIRIFRERHPGVPILVVSRIRFAADRFYESSRDLANRRRQILIDNVERCRAAGDDRVYFLDGSTLLGEDHYEECTVDGVHPTDLGFMRMADGLTPVVQRILREAGFPV